MATISTLAVQLTARTGPFRKKMKKAGGVITKFAGGIAGVVKKLAKFGAAFIAIAAGGLAIFIKAAFKSLDAVGKLADQIGISVDALQGLQFAAGLTGVSTEKLNKSVQILGRRIGEAQQGIGEGKSALKSLGITIEDIVKLNPEEQFKLIADGIAGLATQSEKAAVANQLFGRAGADLVNTLQLGSKGIAEFIKENRRLQGSLSRLDVKQIEEANDQIQRLKTAFTGFINTLAVKLAPVVRNLAVILTELFINFREKALPVIGKFAVQAIALFRKLATAIIPTVLLWVRTTISSIKLQASVVVTGMKIIFSAISNVLRLITGSEPSFKSFSSFIQEAMIVAKFGIENFGQVFGVVIDSVIFQFFKLKADLFAVAGFIKDNLPALLAEPFERQIVLIKNFVTNAAKLLQNLPGLIKRTVKLDEIGLVAPLEGFKSKLAELPDVLKNRALTPDEIFSKGVLDRSKAGLVESLKDFQKKERAQLAKTKTDIGGFFDNLFNFKLTAVVPDLKVGGAAQKTLENFPNAKRLAAIEAGTVEAFRAEREGAGVRKTDLEKDTERLLEEAVKNTTFQRKIFDAALGQPTVVTIGAT